MDSHQLNICFHKCPLSATLGAWFLEPKWADWIRLRPAAQWQIYGLSTWFQKTCPFQKQNPTDPQVRQTSCTKNVKRTVFHIHMASVWDKFQRHLWKSRGGCLASQGLSLYTPSALWIRVFRFQSVQAQLLGTQWPRKAALPSQDGHDRLLFPFLTSWEQRPTKRGFCGYLGSDLRADPGSISKLEPLMRAELQGGACLSWPPPTLNCLPALCSCHLSQPF